MELTDRGAARRTHMLNDPMRKLIPSVALPSIISMLVSALYNMVDTLFVGQLGTSATGAVGIVMPIMNLLQAVSFIFAHGATSYVSRLLGENNASRASKAVITALVNAMVLGLLYGAAGLFFMDKLLTLFGATPTILPYAREYALYIYIAAPAFAGSYVFNNTLRAEGSTVKALIGMSSGAVLNVVLDPIFIFGLDMGVSGAGLATMIGQIFSFLVLLWFYVSKGRHSSTLTLSIRSFSFEKSMYKELLRIGTPSFFRMGLNSLASILLNTAAGPFGDAVIAGFSIVARILMIVNNALIGYCQGYQPISGYNYGAEAYGRVREAYRFTSRSAFLFMLLCGGLLILLAEPLVGLFRNDPYVIEIGARTLRFQAAMLPLMSVTTVAGMFFQSTGRAFMAFIVVCARQGMCFVPLVVLLPRLFGLDGLIVAQAAADVFALLITLPLLMRALGNLNKRIDECAPIPEILPK